MTRVSFAYRLLVFCPLSMLLLCTIASARPLSIPQSNHGESESSMPRSLITACLVSFLVLSALLTVKLVYMKRRRLTTIRSQSLQSTFPHHDLSNTSSSLLPQVKATHSALLAFLVGCFGSPSRETDMKSVLDKNSLNQCRTVSFIYRLHWQSKSHSSKSYSAICNSSKSVISQPHPSQARITRSISSCTISSEHSTEDATNFWPRRSNLEMLAHPTNIWPNTIAAVAPKRCSLLIDRPCSGQLGDFCENSDASSSFRSRISCTTTVVDYAPTSLRLVGVTDVTAVPYSFLSAFPPSSYVLSPLTGTRDSLQLSRSHSNLTRKSVPPLPPLSSYSLPGQGPSCIYLNDIPLSPRTSVSMGGVSAVADQAPTHMNPLLASDPAKVVATPLVSTIPSSTSTPGELVPRVSDPVDSPLVFAVQKMNRKAKHKCPSAARSRSGIIPGASPLRIVVFPEDMIDRKPVEDTPPCAGEAIDADRIHRSAEDTSYRYPILHSTSRSDTELGSHCLSQSPTGPISSRSVESMKSLAHSDVEGSLSDLSPLQTPKFDHLDDVDIGMLGLDRFRWPDENEDFIQSHSSNIKSDSVALISFWEEGQWVEENYQR